ncbi:hypothetical protein [Mycolicibacterium setense]|uniref:hypothetical protein n=1 Tax=Mycolicibacterium setense TaxID=431269 RepID=UPI0012FF421E|nr:hypothetical protein [Mycolicibacterium setense]MCV7115645.1 hypothetical protein [Mycolicibacterium setense]
MVRRLVALRPRVGEAGGWVHAEPFHHHLITAILKPSRGRPAQQNRPAPDRCSAGATCANNMCRSEPSFTGRITTIEPIAVQPAPSAPHARSAAGFPLGEPLLYLRAVPDRTDRNVFCSIDNVYDQQVAVIRPTTEMPSWTLTRLSADVQFVVLRPDGAVLLHLTRFGGTSSSDWQGQMIQVHDGAGRDIGRLRTTAPVAQFTRSSGYTLGLESNGRWLGATEVHQGFSWREHPVPIFDGNGTSIGRIERQTLKSGEIRQRVWFSDFLLDCPSPLPQPMPELLLAALFAQYLYERLAQGPVNTMFGLFR